MTDFGLTAEFHELGMDAPWQRLLPELCALVERHHADPPRRILEIGAGSGQGTFEVAAMWPDAEIIVIEPDRTMRSMLMGRLASDPVLRSRTTVLSLPVAPGTVTSLCAQMPRDMDLVIAAHMAGILEPVELTALVDVCSAILAPSGVTVITYSAPHTGSDRPPTSPERHVDERTVGRHVMRGVYEHKPDEFTVRYDQLDGEGESLRSATRSRRGPLRGPVDEEQLIIAAGGRGLEPYADLSWPGGLVLRRSSATRVSRTEHHAPEPAIGWPELCRAHTQRLQEADPELGTISPPDDNPIDVLHIDHPNSSVWGVLRRTIVELDDSLSLWGPATRDVLQVRSSETPDPDAFTGLLQRWLTRIDAEGDTGTGDRGAIVRLPDAERGLVRPLLAAGFAPQTTTALLRVQPEMADAPEATALGLRRPQASDRDQLLDLAEQMVASDIAARSAWHRPNARGLLEHYVDEILSHDDGWAYVAEDDSGIIGLMSLNPPQASEWAAPSTSLSPVVYLGMAAVAERARRQGVGRRLLAAVHRQAAATRQRAILLDHATLSPLSAPFWHRHGYRPLWTTWLRPV